MATPQEQAINRLAGRVIYQHPTDLPWHWEEDECDWPRLQTDRHIRIIRNLRLGLKCVIGHNVEHFVLRPVVFCDLVVVDYDDPDSSFQALSYSWSSAFPQQHEDRSNGTNPSPEINSEDEYVLCNGGRIPVTHNLTLALLQMLKLEKDTWFWVDTLSINQSDLVERNIQATRMDRIYEHAELVFVWLGPRDETSDLAIDLMTNIKKYYDETDISERIEGPLPFNDPAVWTSLNMTPFGVNEWNAIGRFFSRTWHRRIWMVQEVVLAKSVSVLCGDRVFSWSIVWHFSKWLYGIGWDKELMLDAAGMLTPDVDLRGIECLRQVFDLALVRNGDSSLPALKYDQCRLFGLNVDDKIPASQLAMLLLHTRGRWATDERDQVYALLGLLPGFTSPIQPDYSKSLTDVFVETAKAIIDATDSLGFVTLADQYPRESSLDLPSWVPNFGSGACMGDALPPGVYDAAANFPSSVNIISRFSDHDSSLLHVEGVLLDTITDKTDTVREILSRGSFFNIGHLVSFVCNLHPFHSEQAFEPLELLFDLLTQGSLISLWSWSMSSTSTDTPHIPRQTALGHYQLWLMFYIAAFSWSSGLESPALELEGPDSADPLQQSPLWRNVTAAIPNYYARYLEIMNKDRTRGNAEWDASDLHREILAPLRVFERLSEGAGDRCLLRTKSKRLLALGSPRAQVGDEIWVLKSGTVPFLLRPVTSGRWRLIGVVYVPGFMYGAASNETDVKTCCVTIV